MLIRILALLLLVAGGGDAQDKRPKKVFIDLDGEGMAGIFHVDTQVTPISAPRYAESRKLVTGEVNAAIEGLFEGGANIVDVADYHSGGNTVAPLEIDARALVGGGRDSKMGLDSSYSAYVFIAYHSMAGTEKGMIAHGWSWTDYQNIRVNGKRMGEIGTRSLLAGTFGIPVIMVSGDEAVCKELRDLVANAECAVVKWGVHRTFGYAISHAASREVIRKTARRAMERLGEFNPVRIDGPVEVQVEFTPEGYTRQRFREVDGIRKIDSRTWGFRGKDFIDAWFKFAPSF
jgi:D-amino peptidase